MKDKIIPKYKRFVPVTTYGKMNGVSYTTANHLCDTGQVKFITTESGQRRIDTMENIQEKRILERLDKTEQMLSALCKQFNVSV